MEICKEPRTWAGRQMVIVRIFKKYSFLPKINFTVKFKGITLFRCGGGGGGDFELFFQPTSGSFQRHTYLLPIFLRIFYLCTKARILARFYFILILCYTCLRQWKYYPSVSPLETSIERCRSLRYHNLLRAVAVTVRLLSLRAAFWEQSILLLKKGMIRKRMDVYVCHIHINSYC